ncbi:MAG: helix-turn-helix domain-containing protein [Prevotella sp.]
MRRFIFFFIFVIFSLGICRAGSQSRAEIEHCLSLSDDSLVHMGDKMLKQGNQKKAMFYYSVVCRRASDTPNRYQVTAFHNAGKIFYSKASLTDAFSYFVKALRISNQLPGKPEMAAIYNDIGVIYSSYENFAKATVNYERGLKYAKGKEYDDIRYRINMNLFGDYLAQNRIDKARQSLAVCQQTPHQNTTDNRFMDQFMKILLMEREGKFNQCIIRLKSLAAWAEKNVKNKLYVCSAYSELYNCYQRIGNQDSAYVYMLKCRDKAKANGLIHRFPNVLNQLSEYYSAKGNRQLAMTLKEEYWNLKDSIYNQRKFDEAQNQQFVYEVARYSQAIDSLQTSKKKHEETIARQRVVIFFVLLVVLVVSFLLYLVYRQNRKLNASYLHLFELNRSLLESHKSLASQRLKPVGKQAAVPVQEQVADTPTQEEEQQVKYKSSSLNEQQSRSLADQITKVMDSSDAFCSADFSLDTLAEMVNSNSKYVSQAIHVVFGSNFTAYVNGFRVDKARERLADTQHFGQYTIKAIGESVGFKSQTSFTNIFKKATGITPAMYQKIALSDAQTTPNS